MSWDSEFFKPIAVPGKRKPLMTLRDAAKYMTSLPRVEQNAEHWRPAATLLGIIGEKGGACFSQSAPWHLDFARARRMRRQRQTRPRKRRIGESAT